MNSDWSKKIDETYRTARELTGDAQSRFLDTACMADLEMRRQVEMLLKEHEDRNTLLNRPAIEFTNGRTVLAKAPDANSRTLNDPGTGRQTVAHYRILEKLDSGGMGEVYRARDERLGRYVAVKFLHGHATEDRATMQRFIREAQAASALNHPNIVTIHEIGEAEGDYFIVMELIEGRNLRAIISQRPSVETLIQLGSQIARALAVAHRAGIVHRDIKPENIMVRDDGYVKVLDFGLARLTPVLGQSAAQSTLTEKGTMFGTLRYMSPEQLRGEVAGFPSDIFALGVVLYEFVTGQHPFPSDSQIGTMQAILSNQAFSPSHLNTAIPANLEALILETLQKDPRLRPSASDVETALSELGSKAVSSPPVPAPRIAKRQTVGHDKERAQLHGAFQNVMAGRGLMVCVSGEPGKGKTTFVEDFLAEPIVNGQSCAVARGRCSERLAGTEAYSPFLEALGNLLRSNAGPSLERTIKLLAPSWYIQIVPIPLEDSLDVRGPDVKAGSQERMKRELAAFLQEVSRFRPLVLFFDDLQWVDESTIDLLAYLAMRFDSIRTLILGTYRPSDLLLTRHPFLRLKLDLEARGACREIPLGFLTPEDVERYIGLEFADHDFPAQFAVLVHTKTEGNPLFMVDLLRYLCDRNVIAQEGRWKLVQSFPDIEREIPASVRSMIQRKIDRLSEPDHRLLAAASAQGYEFDSAVLAKALAMEPSEMEERLQELDRMHAFVRLMSEAEFPDGTMTLRYQFVHVLYQNALYASLAPTRKASLSTAVAQALIAFHGKHNPAIAADLAVLFEAARDIGNASEYFLLAAQHALVVFAYSEAAMLARRGLELLEKSRDRKAQVQKELMLLGTLGFALATTKGYASPAVEDIYKRVRAHLAEIDQDPALVMTLWGLCIFHLVHAELQAARDVAERLLHLAQGIQDAALLSIAHYTLGNACKFLGNFGAAIEHFDKGILFSSQSQDSPIWLSGWDSGVLCRSPRAELLWSVGRPDQALDSIREAVRKAQQFSLSQSMVMARFFAVLIHYWRGEAQEAQTQAETLLRLSGEQRQPDFVAWATILRASTLDQPGQSEEAITDIRESLATLRAIGSELARPLFLAIMAKEYAKAGRTTDGLSVLNEALEIVNRTEERYCEAEVYRLKGELLVRQGLFHDAETCFHKAIGVAREQGSKSFELRAVTSLARLRQTQAKREEAREMLAEIYNWFTEGLNTADLKEARALLDQLATSF